MRVGRVVTVGLIALVSVVPGALAQMQQQLLQPPLSPGRLEAWYESWALKDQSFTENGSKALGEIVFQLEDLNNWVQTTDDIAVFRRWSQDDDVVKSLIPVAASSFRPGRIPATLILGNVVDNTNVCYVLDSLKRSPEIDPNGRYNLLQVVLQVSAYAYDDTEALIRTTLDELEPNLRAADGEDSQMLIARIRDQLDFRFTGRQTTLEEENPRQYADCRATLSAPIPHGNSPTEDTANPETSPSEGAPTDETTADPPPP